VARGSRRSQRWAEERERLRSGEQEPLRPPSGESVEDGWVVRRVAGSADPKPYRCPGCDQVLDGGQPHVVAWPEGRSDDRRHWHTPCWGARGRRTTRVQRSRDAPRY
jgi:hypothetical protein